MQRYNPMTKCLETVKTNDRKTVDSKIKTVNAFELKQGNTIVQTGEKIISVENIGDKVKIIAKRVLAGGARPSIYKVAPNTKIKITDRKTVDADYDSPSQMESKLKNYLAKAKRANSKQELEKINNDLFFYVAKLKSNVLKKYGTTNNKFNSTEEWDKNYSKIASKYMNELQRLVDNFRMKDDRKTVDAKTFYSVTYYVMGRGKETKFFDNPNDAMKFYNKADRADKPKKLTYSNPQKIKELEEYIREQNAYSRYY